MLGGDRPQRFVVARRGRDDAHVSGAGLGDHGRDVVTELIERLLYGVNVVIGQHNRVGGGRTGDSRRGRQAQRRDPRAGVGQQRVDVTVVAAGELDDLGAAGESAGQTHRAHGGVGTGVDQPDQLNRRHPVDDLGGKFAFGGGGGPGRQAGGGGLGDGFYHRRVRVAEDHRSPPADQVARA